MILFTIIFIALLSSLFRPRYWFYPRYHYYRRPMFGFGPMMTGPRHHMHHHMGCGPRRF